MINTKKILIIGGDPNSINSEIIFKSWKKSTRKKIYVISNYELIKNQFKKLNYSINVQKVKDINDHASSNKLKIIDVHLNFKNPFKIATNHNRKFILKSLNLGHKLSLEKNVMGLINCSINKNLLNKKKIGVTEYLSAKCDNDGSEAMLIWNKRLAVCPITTHLDVKDISRNLTKKLIIKKIITIDKWFKKKFKKKVNIAVLGLNPHNAELREGSEEKKIIIPAIKKSKMKKINIDGPHVADTIFINNFKKYDVIVGMFHDQVLAPFKSMFKYNAVNITLGLKYLRVSPDHGTASNLIGKNKANIDSFLQCVKIIEKFGR